MHDIEALKRILGYSEWQLRLRLAQFREILEGHLVRGNRNKILVDNDGLEILRRAKELEERTGDLKVVQNLIKAELQSMKAGAGRGGVESSSSSSSGPSPGTAMVDLREELIQELRRRIKSQEEEIRFLRSQVEQLLKRLEEVNQVLANQLPPPQTPTPAQSSPKDNPNLRPRSRWWQFWRRKRRAPGDVDLG